MAQKERQTMATGLREMDAKLAVDVENAAGDSRGERGTTGTSDGIFCSRGQGQTNGDGNGNV